LLFSRRFLAGFDLPGAFLVFGVALVFLAAAFFGAFSAFLAVFLDADVFAGAFMTADLRAS
jgi:hypothetical protein